MLQDPIGQGGLAMVNVGYDTKVPNPFNIKLLQINLLLIVSDLLKKS